MLFNIQNALVNVGDDEQLLFDVIEIFLSEADQTLDQLKSCLASGDTSNAGKWAHKYKGSSSVFGCDSIGTLAKTIEIKGKAGELDTIKPMAEELFKLHSQLVAELKDYRNHHKAAA